MFLALREIRHQPSKFALAVAVVALVAYLTFFLDGLANGLASSYRTGIEQRDAAAVVITEDSNEQINASFLSRDQVEAGTGALAAQGVDELALVAGTARPVSGAASGETRSDLYVFGLDLGGFARPQVVEGRDVVDAADEVVVDDSLKRDGWGLGTVFQLVGSEHRWTVVGFTHDDTYTTAPMVFADRQAVLANTPNTLVPAVNALLVHHAASDEQTVPERTRQSLDDAGLQALSTQEFINTLSGYSAQVATFSLMVAALIVIAALVLAIFLYVLNLQKKPVFGIMKARGVPTNYLVRSGVVQAAVLSATGVLAGFALTAATSLVLPEQIPFRVMPGQYAAILAAFVLCSVIGGLISVRFVSRIDPAEAIA
ncbi:FtsX-like permease family [Propionibacterium ruminifibrarum]|uniref:FtsX-like permease family n=1 Tax=Propionibacterium ruminifibrarum TaxID=1962131 RepID=A0A375I4Q9_9ACTN|nr:ABC transporter permease [Propionibacterium ruminifibrarum]SPF68432.1 FtsX-like permease family [Propionibacterium ruminifibrarum]